LIWQPSGNDNAFCLILRRQLEILTIRGLLFLLPSS
jgi:hypothetical protein